MRVLVISDTHGKEYNLKRVLEQEEPFDLAVHLGDAEGKHDEIAQMLHCPLMAVKGNCDLSKDLLAEEEITIGGLRVLLTHGHRYYVNMSPMLLGSEAQARNCHIAMFGHTHRPLVQQNGSVLLLNPGSLSEPRQANGKASYMVLTVKERGKVEPLVKFLE